MPQKLTTSEFIAKAQKVYGDKYDYSKVDYKNYSTKVCIICPEHGEFWTIPANFLKGHQCSLCSGNKKMTTDEFIQKSQCLHNCNDDYSKVQYVNNKTKVCIVCPKHGEYWQSPNKHLSGCRCPQCAIEKNIIQKSHPTPYFVHLANLIHQGAYDYSKTTYKNAHTKVCIICPEHGEFWQTPDGHINAQHGCPKCSSSKLENEIRLFFQTQNIQFEEQKHFDWLGKQSLDFYIPESNIAIECQGGQHYRPVHFFGGQKGFEATQHRDSKKKQLCEEHNIQLVYYTHENIIPDTITCFSQKELISKLKKSKK